MIAAIKSVVATGRRMKMRDGFIGRPQRGTPVRAKSWLAPGMPPVLAWLLAWGGFFAGPRAPPRPRPAAIGPLRGGDQHLCAIPQTVGAVDDNSIARRKARVDREHCSVQRSKIDGSRRHRIIRADEVA